MLGLKDVIAPEACAGCRRMARGGLCRDCFARLPRIFSPNCAHCGRPTFREVDDCPDCRERVMSFDRARQGAEFGPVLRRAVHRFKYSGCRSLALPLGELAIEAADEHRLSADAVTWVPPGRDRVRRTGVDHGRLLAECVAGDLGLPALPLVIRVRRTPPQMALSPEDRRANLTGAFRAALCPPESVLVVDDVFTTGSTASEMARALKAAGARRVSVVTAARAFTPANPGL